MTLKPKVQTRFYANADQDIGIGFNGKQFCATRDLDIAGWHIPEGFCCDLASVPRILRIVYDRASFGLRAPILHDFLYRTRPEGVTRKEADQLFRQVMEQVGVGRMKRWVAWAAVRLGGLWAWWTSREK